MVVALSLTNIYPGFSTGNEVHKYYFGVWTLSGIRMWFVARNKRGGWLSLRWVWTTNLSTRTKRWMGDLSLSSSWLGSSLVHSCFFVASWPRAPWGCTFQTFLSTPLLALLLLHLMFSLWVTSMLPCLTCIYDIPAKQSFGCPPCLSFACGLIKDVQGASRDASWCMYG
jgi:hypothetical protein